jgi:hypothetical protein
LLVSLLPQCANRRFVQRHLVHVSCLHLSLFHTDPARRLPGVRPPLPNSDGHKGIAMTG